MKKSRLVNLVLISASLASCNTTKPTSVRYSDPVYYEADVPFEYDSSYVKAFNSNPWQWYYSFRPYGTYYRKHLHHIYGYGSFLHTSIRNGHSGNIATIRGGFGKSSSSAS